MGVADTADDGRLDYARNVFGVRSPPDWRELVAATTSTWSASPARTSPTATSPWRPRAGKHVWVEKPAGRNLAETQEIAAAIEEAGVASAVGFNYRNAPAVELARDLIASGRLGEVRHVRVQMFGDYCAHPDGALPGGSCASWPAAASIGDLASHGIDLVEYVVGPIDRSSPRPPRSSPSVPRPRRRGVALLPWQRRSPAAGRERGPRPRPAAVRLRRPGTLEASRASVGEQNAYSLEVHGSTGALSWDFRRMGELRLCLDQDYQAASWSTHIVGPADGESGAFQPDTAIPLSYDDLKVIEAKRLLTSIASGKPEGATIADMVRAARLADAALRSAAEQRWVALTLSGEADTMTDGSSSSEAMDAEGGRAGRGVRSPYDGRVGRAGCDRRRLRRRQGTRRRRAAAPQCGGRPLPTPRHDVLMRAAALVEERAEAIAALLSAENGKTDHRGAWRGRPRRDMIRLAGYEGTQLYGDTPAARRQPGHRPGQGRASRCASPAASSSRSRRSTTRRCSCCTRSRPRWPPATPSSSSRPGRRR